MSKAHRWRFPRIIGAGIIPAALEMMDQLTIQAVEPAFHAGYPMDAGAVLLIEVDGMREDVEDTAQEIEQICWESGAFGSPSGSNESRARSALEGPEDGDRRHGPARPELLPA